MASNKIIVVKGTGIVIFCPAIVTRKELIVFYKTGYETGAPSNL
ncbi:hypothetical protein [Niastella koreensis]|nr:hypothetical protein [Niastella koreensis]